MPKMRCIFNLMVECLALLEIVGQKIDSRQYFFIIFRKLALVEVAAMSGNCWAVNTRLFSPISSPVISFRTLHHSLSIKKQRKKDVVVRR